MNAYPPRRVSQAHFSTVDDVSADIFDKVVAIPRASDRKPRAPGGAHTSQRRVSRLHQLSDFVASRLTSNEDEAPAQASRDTPRRSRLILAENAPDRVARAETNVAKLTRQAEGHFEATALEGTSHSYSDAQTTSAIQTVMADQQRTTSRRNLPDLSPDTVVPKPRRTKLQIEEPDAQGRGIVYSTLRRLLPWAVLGVVILSNPGFYLNFLPLLLMFVGVSVAVFILARVIEFIANAIRFATLD